MNIVAIFVSHPWAVLPVAAGFAGLWAWRRQPLAATAAALWLAYGAYEHLMLTRVLCSGECNIRIDLLVVYPALAVIGLAALVRTFLPRR